MQSAQMPTTYDPVSGTIVQLPPNPEDFQSAKNQYQQCMDRMPTHNEDCQEKWELIIEARENDRSWFVGGEKREVFLSDSRYEAFLRVE
ncbi:hypothetical protein LCGC14_2365430, partial [marine sediment metagenome]